MSESDRALSLPEHHLLALGSAALLSLRSRLLTEAGAAGAAALREAGYASGDAVLSALRSWVAAREGRAPHELDVAEFQAHASEFFRSAGWGTLRIGALDDAVATIDCDDWAEADADAALGEPACHVTTGLLAALVGEVAAAPLAVLEVECRSAGAARCRFLVGAAEVMQEIFEATERGEPYELAARALAEPE